MGCRCHQCRGSRLLIVEGDDSRFLGIGDDGFHYAPHPSRLPLTVIGQAAQYMLSTASVMVFSAE